MDAHGDTGSGRAPAPHRRGARQPARQRPTPHPTRRPRRGHRHHDDRRPGAGLGDRHRRGIPPEPLERVFERFYRVDPARTHTTTSGGSGIGLTITRAIVHAHGGHIRARSQGLGHGARFTITLPAARGH